MVLVHSLYCHFNFANSLLHAPMHTVSCLLSAAPKAHMLTCFALCAWSACYYRSYEWQRTAHWSPRSAQLEPRLVQSLHTGQKTAFIKRTQDCLQPVYWAQASPPLIKHVHMCKKRVHMCKHLRNFPTPSNGLQVNSTSATVHQWELEVHLCLGLSHLWALLPCQRPSSCPQSGCC